MRLIRPPRMAAMKLARTNRTARIAQAAVRAAISWTSVTIRPHPPGKLDGAGHPATIGGLRGNRVPIEGGSLCQSALETQAEIKIFAEAPEAPSSALALPKHHSNHRRTMRIASHPAGASRQPQQLGDTPSRSHNRAYRRKAELALHPSGRSQLVARSCWLRAIPCDRDSVARVGFGLGWLHGGFEFAHVLQMLNPLFAGEVGH